MKKNILIFLCIVILSLSNALAATQEEQVQSVLSGSRLTRYEEPIAGKIKSYTKVSANNQKGTAVAEVNAGNACTILGESGDEYLIAVAKGAVGYVPKSKVEAGEARTAESTGDVTLSASIQDQDVPFLMIFGYGTTIKGTIVSNAPITSVSIMLYNFRNVREECGVYLTYAASQNVTEIELSKLSKQIPFAKLRPGDRYLTITVTSGDQTAVLYNSVFCISGNFARQYSAVNECSYSTSQSNVEKMTDGSCLTGWKLGGKTLTITFPKGAEMDSIQTEWLEIQHNIHLTYRDEAGNVIEEIEDANEGSFYITRYDAPENAASVDIQVDSNTNMLVELYVYKKGEVSTVAQNWQILPDKVDVMLICAHRDDECMFFGGIVPWCVSQGKTVAIVYMTDPALGRPSYTETLNALWVLGERYYPVYIGMVDERAKWEQNIEDWGGYDNMYEKVVEVIRRYKPDVVVGHDLGGEFGHYNHILTADATMNGVLLAGDAANYPESAEKYGAWDVPKYYMHLYDPDHRIEIDFNEPLESLMNLSPLQTAFVAFEKHTTQAHHSDFYALDSAGRDYDNTCFGLYRSLVGPDILNNDLFENLGGEE